MTVVRVEFWSDEGESGMEAALAWAIRAGLASDTSKMKVRQRYAPRTTYKPLDGSAPRALQQYEILIEVPDQPRTVAQG